MKKTYISPVTDTVIMQDLMETFPTSDPREGGASGGRAKQYDIVIDEDDEEEDDDSVEQTVQVSKYIHLHSAWED